MTNGITGAQNQVSLPRYNKGFVSAKVHNTLADAIERNGIPMVGQVPTSRTDQRIRAWITGNTPDGMDTGRWFYSLVEIFKTDTGYGKKWAPVKNGLTCSASDATKAYHYAEDMNDTDAMSGSDINPSDLPKNSDDTNAFRLTPVGNNVHVLVDIVYVPQSGGKFKTEYWFERLSYNSVNGTCPTDDSTGTDSSASAQQYNNY